MPAKKFNLPVFTIFLGTLVLYAPVLTHGFFWDDWVWIPWNPLLYSWHGLAKIWFNPFALEAYYPLTVTTFWLERHIWGLNPFGYHLVSVLLHATNAVLVGLILSKLDVRGAWLAAAIFAWHPIQVESVGWITERKNVLSLFFYLLAILSYIRFYHLDALQSGGFKQKKFYLLALLFFSCSILSKPTACTFPFTVLILLWWKQNQIKRRDIFLLIPVFVLALAVSFITILVERVRIGTTSTEFTWTFLERCSIAIKALYFYVGKLFWPTQLVLIYPKWEIHPSSFLFFSLLFILLIFVGLLKPMTKETKRGVITAVLFFMVSLAPTFGFFNVSFFTYSFVANWWLYLPSIGLITLFSVSWEKFWDKLGTSGVPSFFKSIATVLILLTLSGLTAERIWSYRDEENVWRAMVSKNPKSAAVHFNLGVILERKGKVLEAVNEYDQTLKLDPHHPGARNNLNLLTNSGRNV